MIRHVLVELWYENCCLQILHSTFFPPSILVKFCHTAGVFDMDGRGGLAVNKNKCSANHWTLNNCLNFGRPRTYRPRSRPVDWDVTALLDTPAFHNLYAWPVVGAGRCPVGPLLWPWCGIQWSIQSCYGTTYSFLMCIFIWKDIFWDLLKHSSRLLRVEDYLHVAVSNIEPRIQLICSKKQAQPCHWNVNDVPAIRRKNKRTDW